jgi:hypothetical protein
MPRPITMLRIWGFATYLALFLLATQQSASAEWCSNTWGTTVRTYFCQEGYTCETMDCLYCDVCDTNCSCDSMILCWCDDRAVFLRSCWAKACDTGVPTWKPGPLLPALSRPACLPPPLALPGMGGAK